MRASCALTLAKKYKLRTLGKVFHKFGADLECKETEVTFYKPSDLRSNHEFRKNKAVNPDVLIAQTWAGKDTKSIFNENCTVCGTTSFVEMHHIRTVKDIRSRFKRGDKITFAQFKGAIMRKQVPLCSYHHSLLHKGQLIRYRKSTQNN